MKGATVHFLSIWWITFFKNLYSLVCVKLFHPCVAFHIETSHLFCGAKQITGFYIKWITGLKCVKGFVKRAELNKCDICLISRILWHKRTIPSLNKWRLWRYSPVTFRRNFSLQVYVAPFQWKLFILFGKKLWRSMLIKS